MVIRKDGTIGMDLEMEISAPLFGSSTRHIETWTESPETAHQPVSTFI